MRYHKSQLIEECVLDCVLLKQEDYVLDYMWQTFIEILYNHFSAHSLLSYKKTSYVVTFWQYYVLQSEPTSSNDALNYKTI